VCSYGFVVYMDPGVTDVACAGLNGMRMGERTLTVRRATEVRVGESVSPS
jgi:splicing factor U2AF 65 kDa subunit